METIYLEHEEQPGREVSSAAFQGQVGCEEGMPGAKAASGPCLLLPASLQPQNPAPRPRQGRRSAISSPHPQLRAALPSGMPHQTSGFIYC